VSKNHILVIEDNPADVDLLQRALGSAELDCELTVIDDGAEALALARQSWDANTPRLDLAIIDLNLPKHGGLEILEEMRKNRSFAQLPVLILTSSSSLRERAIMEKFRVGRFVTKPPDLEEYLRIGLVVRELLAESGSLSEEG
jgi:two-component system, chemotaxis family, response regulator Rcp1